MSSPFINKLGLLASLCKEINLTQIIDQVLGILNKKNINFGQLFVAM
jgi:hypothetical protein